MVENPGLTLWIPHWRLLTQVWAPSPGQATLLLGVPGPLEIYEPDFSLGFNEL